MWFLKHIIYSLFEIFFILIFFVLNVSIGIDMNFVLFIQIRKMDSAGKGR